MFKLASNLLFPAKAKPCAQNHFNRYAVAMPAQLMPVLQKRIYTVLLHKFYGQSIPYDLSQTNLISLDNLMVRQEHDEAHNLIIDGLHLSLLKRFVLAERYIVKQAHLPLTPMLDNNEYWGLLSELLASLSRPTYVVNLSFCP